VSWQSGNAAGRYPVLAQASVSSILTLTANKENKMTTPVRIEGTNGAYLVFFVENSFTVEVKEDMRVSYGSMGLGGDDYVPSSVHYDYNVLVNDMAVAFLRGEEKKDIAGELADKLVDIILEISQGKTDKKKISQEFINGFLEAKVEC
jgi:hypothetical protein